MYGHRGWFGISFDVTERHSIACMESFPEFVAIRLGRVSNRTVDYKSISSFLSSIKGIEGQNLNGLLKVWVADMFDRGLALASRKRYVEKLGALYKEYCGLNGLSGNPFVGIKELCAVDVPVNAKSLEVESLKIEKAFDVIMSAAVSKPELAVFLYLLFNASSDIEKAISLTTEEYEPKFSQLDEIIRPSRFHHRRKYVFDLGQSRKRMPQLVREVTNAIEVYLRTKDIVFPGAFTPDVIVALWMAKARRNGVSLLEIRQAVSAMPSGYEYLSSIEGAALTSEEIFSIKRRVAESLAPSGKRWYAIKLRRGVAYDAFADFITANCFNHSDDCLLFYPQKEIIRRVEKKIVTKTAPVIPDIVFIYLNPRHVRKVDALIKTERSGYVFRVTSAADSEYSVIDTPSMTIFQRMIGVFTPDIKLDLTTESPVGIGREVVITGGVMSGYEGTIFDIKEGSDMRHIYVRLSQKYSIKAEVKVEEMYVKAIG